MPACDIIIQCACDAGLHAFIAKFLLNSDDDSKLMVRNVITYAQILILYFGKYAFQFGKMSEATLLLCNSSLEICQDGPFFGCCIIIHDVITA